jgi:hypothetical protein
VTEPQTPATDSSNPYGLDEGQLIEALRPPMESLARACFRRALEQADDVLFDRAEREESASGQDSFFTAMRELRLYRQALTERFVTILDQSFQNGFRYRSWREAIQPDADGWSLMGSDEVEEEVAIEGAISRLRSRHSASLMELESRLRHVIALEGSGNDNLFDPGTLVTAFAAVIHETRIAIQPRIIVYKLFEKQLLAGLGEIYRALNAELREAGLAAERDKQTGGSAPRPRSDGEYREHDAPGNAPARTDGQAPPVAAFGSPNAASPGDWIAEAAPSVLEQLPAEQEVVSVLYQLAAAARGHSGQPATDDAATSGHPADVTTADGRAVAGILSAIQRHVGQHRREPLEPTHLKSVLTRGLNRNTGAQQLERSVDETIDIVSMLFEVILEDDRLPEAIEAQFARLQVPVLKVALTDRDFLASSAHPARQLFNTLARAALALPARDNVESDPVYCNIHAAIERVIDEFHNDPAVFQTVLEAFEAWQWQSGRGSIASDQARGAAEARKARVDAVRERVTEVVESRIANAPHVPPIVPSLLREAWFKVLFITGIKHGVDSEAWSAHATVMDSIVWAMTRHDDPVEGQRVIQQFNALLQRIQHGLNGIMYSPAAINEFLQRLREDCPSRNTPNEEPANAADHQDETAAESEPRDDDRMAASLATPASHRGINTTSPAESTESDDQLIRQIAALPICSWFEFIGDDGVRQRACLQARVDSGQCYIFADRQGRKVAEYSIQALIEGIEAGEIRPIEENALFERALESVIGRLRAQAS